MLVEIYVYKVSVNACKELNNDFKSYQMEMKS